jgi:phage protein D
VPDVFYELRVDGGPAKEKLLDRIRSVEVEEHASMADMVRLRLAVAPDPKAGGWTVLDDGTFERMTPLRVGIRVGPPPVDLVVEGFVIETRAALSGGPGGSSLEVVAMDATHTMNREEKVRSWEGMADSAIAREVIKDHDLTPRVEPTQPSQRELGGPVVQRGTDARFLRRLADRNGYVFYVETPPFGGAAVGHFESLPVRGGQPQEPLKVRAGEGSSVSDLEVRYRMLAPARARAKGLTVKDGETQSAEVSEVTGQPLGGESTLVGEGTALRLIGPAAFQAESGELQGLAEAVVDRSSYAVEVTGSVDASSYGSVLRAKRTVDLQGAGRRFSGEYRVRRVLHALGDGYTQEFTLERNGLGT